MAFALDYRPATLDQVIGNEAVIATLKSYLENERRPHTAMFTGPFGCGKTSLARIVARELGATEDDIQEFNFGLNGGVDTVRGILGDMLLAPSGKCRVFILDECFAQGTLVQTPTGVKPIESFKAGDSVYSLAGLDKVKQCFVNRVGLDRLVRLQFSDGSVVFTTKQHEFFTSEGWKEAQSLTKWDCIYPHLCYTVDNTAQQEVLHDGLRSLQEGIPSDYPSSGKADVFIDVLQDTSETAVDRGCSKGEVSWGAQQNLRILQGPLCAASVSQDHQVLFKDMCSTVRGKSECQAVGRLHLPIVWWSFSSALKAKTKILFLHLSQSLQEFALGWSFAFAGNASEEHGVSEVIFCRPHKIIEGSCSKFPTNEGAKSRSRYGCGGEDSDVKATKRDVQHNKEISRGERKDPIRTTSDVGSGVRMGNRLSRFVGCARGWLSNTLQMRPSLSTIEVGGRGGRHFTSYEELYLEGQKERGQAHGVRLENSTFYEQEDYRGSFGSVVGDTERAQGYVNFYDLEVVASHSYFVAGGIPVHNCHRASTPAQDGLLKAFEEPPQHVYFIVATTDPGKLLPTIKSRCTEFKVKSFDDANMQKLLMRVCRKEKLDLSDEVLDAITDAAMGSGRNGLSILEQISKLETDKERIAAIPTAAAEEDKAFPLACLLYAGKGKPVWSTVAGYLKELEKEEPEKIRQLMLAFGRNRLLKDGSPTAYGIMSLFKDPFYVNGKELLAMACYEAVQLLKGA